MLYLLLALLLLLPGCAAGTPEPPPAQEVMAPVEEPTAPEAPQEPELPPEPAPPEERSDPRADTITAILEAMTVEEKVGQLFWARYPSTNGPEFVEKWHPGGLILFGKDFKTSDGQWLTRERFTEMVDSVQSCADVPLLVGVDEEGGTVARATRNPNLFPKKRRSPQQILAQGGMETVLADTEALSRGLLDLGINVNLAPVVDVTADKDSFIYDRTFGGDYAATADHAAQVVKTMTDCGIGSVLKHFPGYGGTADTHTGEAVDPRPLEDFRTGDLLPFKAGIDAGAGAVLVSHNRIPAMDEALPASLSPEVHRILREELGFMGVSVTDDLDMGAVQSYVEDGSAVVLAIKAGNDLIITGNCETQIPQVLEALASGELTEEALDTAVSRVLGWKYDLGLLTPLEAKYD